MFVHAQSNYATPYAITTLAGVAPGSADGAGTSARFDSPKCAALDSAGNLYVADSVSDTIRKVTQGGAVTTIAGSAGQSGSTDGTGSAARFHTPYGVAVDSSGNVFVSEVFNCTIRKVSPTGVVTTLAGTAGKPGGTDGTGTAASFNFPNGIAVDAAGDVYVADSGNNTIRMITPLGVVTTLVGSAGNYGSADGTGGSARFNWPSAVAVDGSGNVYVTD